MSAKSRISSGGSKNQNDSEKVRRFIAEDLDWNLRIIPRLTQIATDFIIENFLEISDIFQKLPEKYRIHVVKQIPTNLPLSLTVQVISDEKYWQRCCLDRWRVCNVAVYGNSWKRMFMERNLEALIENYVPLISDNKEILNCISHTGQYIERLDLKQLLPPVIDENADHFMESEDEEDHVTDHIDFGPILNGLKNLKELHVTFSVKNCGMNFEWRFFGITNLDAIQLTKYLAVYKNLELIHLHRSSINDDKCRLIVANIMANSNLRILDLSYNNIGPKGCKAIAKLIKTSKVLEKIDLTFNSAGTEGAQAIAKALCRDISLKTLIFKLNKIEDVGGLAIFDALKTNKSLQVLDISSNYLSYSVAQLLSEALEHNKVLKHVMLANNKLTLDGGKMLRDSVEKNTTLISLEVEGSDCGHEIEYALEKIIDRNRHSQGITGII